MSDSNKNKVECSNLNENTPQDLSNSVTNKVECSNLNENTPQDLSNSVTNKVDYGNVHEDRLSNPDPVSDSITNKETSISNDFETALPSINMLAIGIDLGTTFSCAAVYQDGNSEIIPNKAGHRLTPSQVFYYPDSLEVSCGNAAYDMSPTKSENFLSDMKRIIGRKFDDAYVQRLIKSHGLPYRIICGEDGNAVIQLLHDNVIVEISPEQACSEILRYLRESACEKLGNITEAVISVPAKFSGAQRKATRDAAQLAGFTVLKLITEPVAAAIYYARDKLETSGKLLVFDFGGGTLDVSIIEVQSNKFEVICVEGDTFLGGRDFDQILLDYFIDDITKKFGKEIINAGLLRRLKKNCEKLKQYLSDNIKQTIPIEYIGGKEEVTYLMDLTRSTFETLCKDLFDKSIHLVQQCLLQGGLQKSDINTVLLVGGTTRIPNLRERIGSFFERVPVRTEANPDEAVALGAAIQAALLKGNYEELETYKITEVTPASLGTSVGRGMMSTIIKKNTPLPTTKTESYTTARNNQDSCGIQIFEGERKNCKFNNVLGSFTIDNMPEGKAGSVSFDVTFSLNEDGILEVTAVENSTGVNNKLIVTLENFHLCEHQVQNMLKDAEDNKQDDKIFTKFAFYEQETMQYANHVLFELEKLNKSLEHVFVFTKCIQFLVTSREIDYKDFDVLKEMFAALRKDIEPLIEGKISVEEYLPSEVDFSSIEAVLESLFSRTSITLEDFRSLFPQ